MKYGVPRPDSSRHARQAESLHRWKRGSVCLDGGRPCPERAPRSWSRLVSMIRRFGWQCKLCGAGLRGPQETMGHAARIDVVSRDRVGWVVRFRDGALAAACARA